MYPSNRTLSFQELNDVLPPTGRRIALFGMGLSLGAGASVGWPATKAKVREICPDPLLRKLIDQWPGDHLEEFAAYLKLRFPTEIWIKAQIMLRKLFCLAMIGLQEDLYRQIGSARFSTAANFIEAFDGVYFTSVDLIGYWALIKCRPPFDDGFRSNGNGLLVFKGWTNERTMAHLHGSGHIFEVNEVTIKARAGFQGLPKSIKALADEWESTMVFEADSIGKQSFISQRDYLLNAWEMFSRERGTLFLMGTSLSEFDDHLCLCIARAKKLNVLAVGLYHGDLNGTIELRRSASELLKRANSRRHPENQLRLEFFWTPSDIWMKKETVPDEFSVIKIA